MAEHANTNAIAAAIPFGQENAISRKELAAKLGMSDRKMRKCVEEARADGLLILNDQNGRGYWQSNDIDELRQQYDQDTARALSILQRRKPLRDALVAAGVEVNSGGVAMIQYCRYCSHALDYNGEAKDFICEADALCGNNGAGKLYDAKKAKSPNRCKHFEYCQYDIFRCDKHGNLVEYKPRAGAPVTVERSQGEQLSLL